MSSRVDFEDAVADIQALLGGDSPGPDGLDDASRIRLDGIRQTIISRGGAPGQGRAWRSGRLPRRRPGLRFALPAAGVAVATAVTVVVVVAAPGPGLPTPGVYHLPAGARAQAGSIAAGQRILLTAAETVAHRNAAGAVTPGRFWVSRTEVGNFLTVGPVGNRYVILERASNQEWAASSPNTRSPALVRMLGAQLASAADEAAWRRDGSPGSWNVQEDTSLADPHGAASGFDRDITVAPGNLTLFTVGMGGKQFSFGRKAYSAAELLRLPADPARLKALLLAVYDGPQHMAASAEAYLFEVTPALLTLPVTPAVRSALYRMLAGLPGVRSLGQVQDAAGQYGQGVALDGRYSRCGGEAVKYPGGGVDSNHPVFGSCVVEQRLVINPRTGLPLAQELRYVKLPGDRRWPAPDGLFSFQLFQRAYWTNASPPSTDGH